MSKKQNEIFDFGFSINQEEPIIEEPKEKMYTANDVRVIIDDLLEEFKPLFKNLKSNPEKPTIRWPDRAKKIEEFEQHLEKYINTLLSQDN